MLGTEPPRLKDGSSSTFRMLKSSSVRCLLRFYLSWFWVSPLPLQVLNRDLWSNAGVKAIVGEHFVFWQQYKVICEIVKQNPDSEVENEGKWRGSQIYDLLPDHRVATCFHSWPKDRREHGHLEQVEMMNLPFLMQKMMTTTNSFKSFASFIKVAIISFCSPHTTAIRLDAAAFPTLITEFLSLHPSLESPGKEEPPRKKVAVFLFYVNYALYGR